MSVILAIFTSMSSAHHSYRNGRVQLFYDYNSIYNNCVCCTVEMCSSKYL